MDNDQQRMLFIYWSEYLFMLRWAKEILALHAQVS